MCSALVPDIQTLFDCGVARFTYGGTYGAAFRDKSGGERSGLGEVGRTGFEVSGDEHRWSVAEKAGGGTWVEYSSDVVGCSVAGEAVVGVSVKHWDQVL